MKRRVLVSTLVIALIAGLVGAATWAYFSDVETSSDNTFTAGTLDLSVDGGGSLPFVVSNVAPADSGTESGSLANVGSIAGELDIAMSATTNADNGQEEPENDQSTDTGTGDLGGQAKMGLYVDKNENGSFDAGDVELLNDGSTSAYDVSTNNTVEKNTVDSYGAKSWDAATNLDAAGGADPNANLVMDWEVPSGTDNRIMGDSVSYDLTFTLEQAAKD